MIEPGTRVEEKPTTCAHKQLENTFINSVRITFTYYCANMSHYTRIIIL